MRQQFKPMLLASLITACGAPGFSGSEGDKSPAHPEQRVEITANMSGQDMSLLASEIEADDFTIKVEGCATGHTVTLTKVDADASLYLFDKNCVGKLIDFTVDGEIYTPAGAGFNGDYQVGSVATFQSSSGKSLEVRVRQQVAANLHPDLIDENECQNVVYAFNGIIKGNSKDITPDAVGVKGKVVGDALPYFHLKKAKLLDINGNGSGVFRFNLICDAANLTPAQMATCQAQIPSVRYLLVEDTYGGNLSLNQAQQLFATLTSHVPAQSTATSFTTVNLDGPQTIHFKRHMLLVVQIGTSYQYFEVDIKDLPDVQCGGPQSPC